MLSSRNPFRSSLPSGRVPGSSSNAAKPQQPLRMGKISRQTIIEKGLPKVVRAWKGKASSAMMQRVKRVSKDVYHQLRYGRQELSKNRATALIGQMQEQLPKAEQEKSAAGILKDMQREMRREQEQVQIAAEQEAGRAVQQQAEAQARLQHKQQLRQAVLQQAAAQNSQAGLTAPAAMSVAAFAEKSRAAPQGTGGQVSVGPPPASSIMHAPASSDLPSSGAAPLAGTSVPASIPTAVTEQLHLTTDVVVPSSSDEQSEKEQDDDELPDVSQIHEGGLPL